jgi:hypothetical protein
VARLLISKLGTFEGSSRRARFAGRIDVDTLAATLAEGPTRLFESVLELNDLLNAHTVDLKRVGGLIRKDPTLASLIFRLSKFLSQDSPQFVSTIEEAAVSLGIERLRVLILSSAFVEQWRNPPRQPQQFRGHCLASAMLSDRISRWLGYAHPEIAYLAGFLHPLGRIGPLRSCELVDDSIDGPSRSLGAIADCGDAEPRQPKQVDEIPCDFGPVFTEVFERHRSRRQVHVDWQLAGIVAAACQASIERRGENSNAGPCQTGNDLEALEAILQTCLPDLGSAERAKLAEIIAGDLRGLVPFLEFTSSEIAGRASVYGALDRWEEAV